jgi:hypothetical protein
MKIREGNRAFVAMQAESRCVGVSTQCVVTSTQHQGVPITPASRCHDLDVTNKGDRVA